VAPLEDLLGAVEVGRGVARRIAAVARGPVAAVDLPETDIDGAVAVLVAGVGIAARLVLDNTLTAALGPARVLAAPLRGADVHGATAGAAAAVGAVDILSSSSGSEGSKDNLDKLHVGRERA